VVGENMKRGGPKKTEFTKRQNKRIDAELKRNPRPHTLEEIGKLLGGMSREGVRQIQVEALRKARAACIALDINPLDFYHIPPLDMEKSEYALRRERFHRKKRKRSRRITCPLNR